MKFFIKIPFFMLLFSAFSADSQDQCMFYPEYCKDSSNLFNPECQRFPDHCGEAEPEREVYETDPYCDRNSYNCKPKLPLPSVREITLSKPSVFDQLPPRSTESSESEDTKRKILQAVLIQVFQRNPDTYLAFEFASRGDKAYQFFESSKSSERLKQSFFNLISNVGLGFVSMPDISELEVYKHSQRKKQFRHFKPEMERSLDRAAKVADLYFLCKGEGFNCPAFHDRFQGTGFDSQALAINLKKASDYAIQNDSNFPIKKDLEYFQLKYPSEANLVTNLQIVENQSKEEQIRAFNEAVRVKDLEQEKADRIKALEDLKASDPFYTGEDPVLLDLENKSKFYKSELDKLTEKIAFADENTSLEDLSKLISEKEKHEMALVRIKKDKDMYDHKQFTREASAWLEASTVFAQAVGMPKEVVQVGQALSIGMKIYDSGMSMIINGALDPTGITAITQGINSLAGLIFGIKSAQQIMQESLNQIQQNTEKILEKLDDVLANQDKMLVKLDEISGDLEYMRELMQKNHREITENFSAIQHRLNQIEQSMQFGFQSIMDDHRRQDVESVLNKAYGHTKELSFNPNNLNCFDAKGTSCQDIARTRSSARVLLGEMFKTFDNVSQAHFTKDFSELTKTEIEEYLKNTSVEGRLSFLPSMVSWLNNTAKRWVSLGEQTRDYPPSHYVISVRAGEHGDGWEDLLKLDKETQDSVNESIISSIVFGEHSIPNPPENISYPSYQDKIFSEYIGLSSLLPPRQDLGFVVHDDHVDRMCQNISNIESLSIIMRENLQKAWNVYQIYSHAISDFISKMPPPSIPLKIKIADQKSEERVKGLIQYSQQRGKLKDLPYYYRYGAIDSYDFNNRAERDFEGKSAYFTDFSNIVSKVIDHELKDWKFSYFIDYGYSKRVKLETPNCLRKEVLPPSTIDCPPGRAFGGICHPEVIGCLEYQEYGITLDREAFKEIHTKEWAWFPAYFYDHIISELNRYNLITDWMRARLAVDTMAKVGYGSHFFTHPELSSLNRLIKTLSARREPFPVDRYFEPKTKVFSEEESSQIAQFFKDIENMDSSNHYTYGSEKISPFHFIHSDIFQCRTNDIKKRDFILRYKNFISFIKGKIKSIQEENLSDFTGMKVVNSSYEENPEELVLLLERILHILDKIMKISVDINVDEYQNIYNVDNRLMGIAVIEGKGFFKENVGIFSELADSYRNSYKEEFESKTDCDDFSDTKQNITPLLIEEFGKEFFQELVKEYQENPDSKEWQRFSEEERKIIQKFARKRYKYENASDSERKIVENLFETEFLPLYLKWNTNDASFAFHLPLPSEDLWENKPSLGVPEFRREALFKANLFEHLRPQNCLVNIR